MIIKTKDDVHEMMGAYLQSAALNAALELGLFWLLADGRRSLASISQEMNIPEKRCRYWLGILAGMNLLRQDGDGYDLSPVARKAIVNTYSRDAWKMLALDAWDNFEESLRLGQRVSQSGSDRKPFPSYVQKMDADLGRARLFTKMLFELHSPLAQDIADALHLNGARTLLDVGGGSGVVSLTLLRRHPELAAVVVDIPNVCTAGREIADKVPEGDRISYHPADFTSEELPTDFDIVLYCDVAQFDDSLLARLARSLNEGGRLVIVNHWFDRGQEETVGRLGYLLTTSLSDPDFSLRTLEDIQGSLAQAGLAVEPIRELPYKNWKMIVARKG